MIRLKATNIDQIKTPMFPQKISDENVEGGVRQQSKTQSCAGVRCALYYRLQHYGQPSQVNYWIASKETCQNSAILGVLCPFWACYIWARCAP